MTGCNQSSVTAGNRAALVNLARNNPGTFLDNPQLLKSLRAALDEKANPGLAGAARTPEVNAEFAELLHAITQCLGPLLWTVVGRFAADNRNREWLCRFTDAQLRYETILAYDRTAALIRESFILGECEKRECITHLAQCTQLACQCDNSNPDFTPDATLGAKPVSAHKSS